MDTLRNASSWDHSFDDFFPVRALAVGTGDVHGERCVGAALQRHGGKLDVGLRRAGGLLGGGATTLQPATLRVGPGLGLPWARRACGGQERSVTRRQSLEQWASMLATVR